MFVYLSTLNSIQLTASTFVASIVFVVVHLTTKPPQVVCDFLLTIVKTMKHGRDEWVMSYVKVDIIKCVM